MKYPFVLGGKAIHVPGCSAIKLTKTALTRQEAQQLLQRRDTKRCERCCPDLQEVVHAPFDRMANEVARWGKVASGLGWPIGDGKCLKRSLGHHTWLSGIKK